MNTTIKFRDQDIEISTVPIRKYAKLVKVVANIFRQVPQDKLTTDGLLENLPDLVESNWDDIVQLLSVATPLTPEQIDVMGLRETIDVLAAVFEVNEYDQVYARVKKALAHLNQGPIIPGEISPEPSSTTELMPGSGEQSTS